MRNFKFDELSIIEKKITKKCKEKKLKFPKNSKNAEKL